MLKLALLFVVMFGACGDDDTAPEGAPSHHTCSEGERPTFSAHITDLDKVHFIVPSGNVHDAGQVVGRSYLHLIDRSVLTPVYAPTAALLVNGAYYQDVVTTAPYSDEPDYALTFEVSCDYTFGFAHLKQVSERIAALLPGPPAGDSPTQNFAQPIAVAAGELIGYMRGVDFFVFDRSQQNQFANQSRYTGDASAHGYDNDLYQVCPFDFWGDPMRGEYRALYGAAGALYPGGTCSTSRDVVGTVAGQWFITAERQSMDELVDADGYSHELALARELSPSVKIAKPGNRPFYVYGEGHPFGGEGDPTFLDPVEITVGEDHCYQRTILGERDGGMGLLPDGWLYVSLTSAMQMQVVYGPSGSCPASFPGGGRTYYR